jgi:hypothetical protein
MEKSVARPTEVVLALLVTVTVVVLLASMPSWATAGLAVAAASSWCFWLDRHPTT